MQFTIRSIDKTSSVSTITLEAADQGQAQAMARERGLKVLSIKGSGTGAMSSGRSSGRSSFPLGQFSQELLTLLNAGLALVESIETLCEKEAKAERKSILEKLVADLYRGSSFSSALAQYPNVFPALFVATVKASERTGGLPEALEKYVAYQGQLDTVKKKVISASIYPALLVVAGSMVIAFLLGYVVPRFSRIFEDMGGEIPWMSKLLIQWGHFVHAYGTMLLTAVVSAIVALVVWLRRPGTPERLVSWLQRVPSVGERIRIYQLARFYRSLGMLLRGGMPAVASLELVAGLLPGTLHQQLTGATRLVREGTPISQAMEKSGLTSSVSARMLRVGERTGQMGEMMERIAMFYDSEISQWIDWFVKLFEPLLMAFIGLIIGFIVVIMYFPIFELAGSIR
jgi:general secretion pathway protein F